MEGSVESPKQLYCVALVKRHTVAQKAKNITQISFTGHNDMAGTVKTGTATTAGLSGTIADHW